MQRSDIWVLGGYQTDFSRNWTREGLECSDMFDETVSGTLAAARVDAGLVEVIHVGNAFGQLFTGQGHLGAMPATVAPELWSVPSGRHEGACASGSLAMLGAMADLEAGRYGCALVIGAEIERSVPGDEAAKLMTAAAWAGHEGQEANVIWAHMFSAVADEYDLRYGLDDQHLRAIGELNLRNAKANPLAQTRAWDYSPQSFEADNSVNPIVEGRLRRNDCSQITDGAAGVVLVTGDFLVDHPELSGLPRARVKGWGHRTAGLPLDQKLARSANDLYVLPHVRQSIVDAFTRGGIADVDQLDMIETHDCFTMSEYAAIDHFGITAPGESWKAIESGDLEIGGRLPVNPGGGLIGIGHPVGATGVRMVFDAYRQVTDQAGETQVEGARNVGTLNIGGSTATTISFVIGNELDP